MTNFEKLTKMDLPELRALQMIVNKLIENKVTATVSELTLGDVVKVNHHKVAGMLFNVVKINRKKIKVKHPTSGATYNVSKVLVEKY